MVEVVTQPLANGLDGLAIWLWNISFLQECLAGGAVGTVLVSEENRGSCATSISCKTAVRAERR